jgi:hypothetical protein
MANPRLGVDQEGDAEAHLLERDRSPRAKRVKTATMISAPTGT